MQDIFVGKFCVSGVQPNLRSKFSKEWMRTSKRGHLIGFGDFDCRDEDMMEPHHSTLHRESLFLSFIREYLPSSGR